eukprot:6196754-Pleurochrysis_carterae.AAC.3
MERRHGSTAVAAVQSACAAHVAALGGTPALSISSRMRHTCARRTQATKEKSTACRLEDVLRSLM